MLQVLLGGREGEREREREDKLFMANHKFLIESKIFPPQNYQLHVYR